jgi:5-methylcytosine-specific restriction protein A
MIMAKDEIYNKLIHTTRWLRLRRDKLTKHPLCQRCADEGRITPATEVHHVSPVEEAVSYAERERRMYDANNLRSLCHHCHVLTHTEVGRSGKAATRARNDQHVAEIVERFFG